MPLSVREVFLIVRARDEASNTMRRVGQNLARLQTAGELRGRAATLEKDAARVARDRLAAEQALVQKQGEHLRGANHLAKLRGEEARLGEARNRVMQRGGQLLTQAEAAQARVNNLERQHASIMGHTGIGPLQPLSGRITTQLTEAKTRAAALDTQLKALQKAFLDLSAAETKATAATDKQILAVQQLKGELAAAAKLTADLIAEDQALAAEQANVNRELAMMKAANISRVAGAVGALGRTMQYLGGIGVVALGFAANSAAKLRSEATLAATQVGNTARQVMVQSDANFKAILSNMRQFPAASADMSSALYDIFSTLNVKGKQGRDMLVQVNKAAVAGSLTVKDATAGVLSILSNFKEIPQTGAGVERALNRAFAAVRFGRMTMAEFQKTLQTTAPAARAAQQSFDTLAGTMAFLSRSLGPNKAAVGFARLTEVLGGVQMTEGLAKFGVKLTDVHGKFLPLNQQLEILVKRFPYLAQGGQKAMNFFKEIGNIQSTIQARRAFVTLVQNMSGYRDILNRTIGDQNEFKKSYDTMSQSAGVKWGKALNSLKASWIELGDAALPTLVKMIQPLAALATGFANLSPAAKQGIGSMLVIVTVGAVVVGTFLTIVAAIMKLRAAWLDLKIAMAGSRIATGISATVTAIRTLGLEFMAARSAGMGFGESIAMAMRTLGPFAVELALVAAAVAAIAVAWYVYTTFSSSVDKANATLKKLNKSLDDGSKAIGQFQSASTTMKQLDVAIAQQKQAVDKAKYGTLAWKAAEASLNDLQLQRIDTLKRLKQAQLDMTAAQSDTATNLDKLAGQGGFMQAGFQLQDPTGRGAKTVGTYQQALAALRNEEGKGLKANRAYIDVLKGQIHLYQDSRSAVRRAVLEYQQYVSQGVNPASASMKRLRESIMNGVGALSSQDAKSAQALWSRMSKDVTQFTHLLGIVPSPRVVAYINSIPKGIRAGMLEYTKLTGTMLRRPLADILLAHPDQQRSLAAFMATTKARFGTIQFRRQQQEILMVPKFADGDLANFIRKHGRLPKDLTAWIKLEVKGHDEAVRKARKAARDVARATQVQAHLRTEGLSFAPSDASTKALDDAQKKIDALNRKSISINATVKMKGNPFRPFTTAANTASVNTMAALDKIGSHGNAVGVAAGTGFKQGFDANAIGKATVLVTISAMQKSFAIHSPSAVTRDKIGKPAGQGVIEGMKDAFKDKASIQSSINTMGDTMLGAFKSFRDTNKGFMGDLFTGGALQEKLDWGEKLNIKDLTKDLNMQTRTFGKWRHGINTLFSRRGVPDTLVKSIEALGPSAQGSIDALLRATPRQLRHYVRLWQHNQSLLGNATKQDFNRQVKAWRAHGRDMAVGILLGLRDEEPALQAFMRRLAKGMVNALKGHNRSHSPSKLYWEEGRNMAKGLQLGIDSIAVSMPKGGFSRGTGNATGSHQDHTHYHLYNDHNGTLLHQVKKQDFLRRARKN